MLLKSPDTDEYKICQIQAYISYDCSTSYDCSASYKVTLGGSILNSYCLNDGKTALAESLATPLTQNQIMQDTILNENDMSFLPELFLASILLTVSRSRESNNNSIARVLSQLMPLEPHDSTPRLSPKTPSTAEAISVLLAGKLASTLNFQCATPYTSLSRQGASYQSFNSTLRVQRYASGPALKWHAAFYPVLVAMFLANSLCLGYFFVRMGLVVDFTDPQDAFGVALNGPSCVDQRSSSKDSVYLLHLNSRLVLQQGSNEQYHFSTAPNGG
jgi:hypothetical protein